MEGTRPEVSAGQTLVLRPMTEQDWPLLIGWNSDPGVLYYAEGDDVAYRSPEETKAIYRMVSQSAFCFVIEFAGEPVGECWLQHMNLDRVLDEYPGEDVRRIDIMVGEKAFWNRGIGTRVVGLLTDFAFRQEKCDLIYIVDVADYNHRSRRVFEKNGYRLVARHQAPPGSKACYTLEFLLTRVDFLANN